LITGRTQLLINRLLYKDYYEQWIPKQEIKEEKMVTMGSTKPMSIITDQLNCIGSVNISDLWSMPT
jgi:hypothetical protein